MKKNILKVLGIALIVFTTIYSCKKDSVNNTTTPVVVTSDTLVKNQKAEILSPQELEILDNTPEATGFEPTNVILPNGQTLEEFLKENASNERNKKKASPYDGLLPVDAKNLLLTKISVNAIFMANRANFQKPYEGADRPAQNGIAYSWGGKNHNIRQSPPGAGTICTDKIYGLDCSGFVGQLFNMAGVALLYGPANSQRQATVLGNAIKASIPSLATAKVEELGAIATSKMETGDVICWFNGTTASHIGIVMKDAAGTLAVFQSNGVPGTTADDCAKNMGTTRGVRTFLLSDPYWFSATKTYGITRISVENPSQENALTNGSERTWYTDTERTADGKFESITFNKNYTGKGGTNAGNVWTFEWSLTDGVVKLFNKKYISNGATMVDSYTPITITATELTANPAGKLQSQYFRGKYVLSSTGM